MARMTRRERIGTRIYWICLFLYTALLAVAVIYGLKMLWDYAEETEAAVPEYVLNDYMDGINSTHWNSGMEKAAVSLQNAFQTDKDCIDIVKNTLTEQIRYSKRPGTGLLEEKFDLICGDHVIGSMTMEEDQSYASKVKFGKLPWKVTEDSFNFDYLSGSSVSFTIPATYSAKLNGVEVSQDYITETGIPYDVLAPYYEEHPNLPTKVTYQVNNLVGKLDPVIYDESGNEFTIDPTMDDSQFVEPCSAEDMAELQAFISSFLEPYVRFFGTRYVDSTYPTLQQYVKRGSELDSIMQQFLDGASWLHWFNVTLSNVQFESAYELGDGFYVLNVSYDTTNYADYKTVEEPNELRLIVEKTANGIQAVAVG